MERNTNCGLSNRHSSLAFSDPSTASNIFTGDSLVSDVLAHLRSMTIGWTQEHNIEDDQDAENQGSEQ